MAGDRLTDILAFTVPGTPVPKQWPGRRARRTLARQKAWEETVGWHGLIARNAQGWAFAPLGVRLHIAAFFWRDWSRRADLDNLVKGVKDALEGVLYENDSQIWSENLYKMDKRDGASDQLLVIIWKGDEA